MKKIHLFAETVKEKIVFVVEKDKVNSLLHRMGEKIVKFVQHCSEIS